MQSRLHLATAGIAALLAFCAGAPTGVHAAPKLSGTWRSSLELSMQFNRSKAQLESRQLEFLGQILGTMTIRFSEGKFAVCDVDRTITLAGKSHAWHGSEYSGSYDIVHQTADSIIVSYPWPDGIERPSTLHFDGDSTFWTYMAENPSVFDLHAREYFTRIDGCPCPEKPTAP